MPSLDLNLPNFKRRLRLLTKSFTSSSPVWKNSKKLQISTDSNPFSESIIKWLLGFALPSMSFELEANQVKIFIKENLITTLKALQPQIKFTTLQILPFGEFSADPKASTVLDPKSSLPPEEEKKDVTEAFSHLLAIKDRSEQYYLSLGTEFISELLKNKLVSFLSTEIKSLFERKSETKSENEKILNFNYKNYLSLNRINYSELAYSMIESYLDSFVEAKNSMDEENSSEEDSKASGGARIIRKEDFEFTAKNLSVDVWLLQDCAVSTIKLSVSVKGNRSFLARTLFSKSESPVSPTPINNSLKLSIIFFEDLYSKLLEVLRRCLIKMKEGVKQKEILHALHKATDSFEASLNASLEGAGLAVRLGRDLGGVVNFEGFEDGLFALQSSSSLCLLNRPSTTGLESWFTRRRLVVKKEDLAMKEGMSLGVVANAFVYSKPSPSHNSDQALAEFEEGMAKVRNISDFARVAAESRGKLFLAEGTPLDLEKACLEVLVCDTITVGLSKPELLTHCGRKFSKVCFDAFSSSSEASAGKAPGLPEEVPRKEEAVVVGEETGTVRRSARLQKALQEEKGLVNRLLAPISRSLQANASLFSSKLSKERDRLQALAKNPSLSAHSNAENQAEKDLAARLSAMRDLSAEGLPAWKNVPVSISLDLEREIVFLPVFGRVLGVSVLVVKNVSFFEMGEVAFLRIVFNHSLLPAIVSSNEDTEAANNEEKGITARMEIKEMTFKSKKIERLHNVYSNLRTLVKESKQRIKEALERAGLSSMEALALRRDAPALRDIQVRPVLSSRRKCIGALELHTNGLRFVEASGGAGSKIDLLFSNIKFAVVQEPFHTEAYVLLHFELKKAILANKKQTTYLQFFYDSVSSGVDVASRHVGTFGDEGRATRRFTAKFLSFANLIQEASAAFLEKSTSAEKTKSAENAKSLENSVSGEQRGDADPPGSSSAATPGVRFERVYKDLMFLGNLNRSMTPVFLAEHSILCLNDVAPLAILLPDIRLAYFERVVMGLHSVDLAIVFWDVFKDPVRISSIQKSDSDLIRAYFEMAGVRVLEGRMNMDWKTIINEVRKDLGQFAENGAWEFLAESEEEEDSTAEEEAVDSEVFAETSGEGGEEGDEETDEEDREEEEGVSDSDVVDWDEETEEES